MPLKSTNIWDDVRADDDDNEAAQQHGRYRGVRPSVGDDEADSETALHGTTACVPGNTHANRHGVSMKSLARTRRAD